MKRLCLLLALAFLISPLLGDVPKRLSGAVAVRPPATEAIGAIYFATDENKVYESYGSSWVERTQAPARADVTRFFSGLLADRPSPGSAVGSVFYATDAAHSYEAFPTGWFQLPEAGGGGGVSSIPVGKTVFVDSANGNDSTALRARQDKPFLTLTAAKTAAQSGDTIIVGPGTYDERNLLKNGVNWHFGNGAIVSYTGAGHVFDDSVDGANGPVVCNITGEGSFEIAANNHGNSVFYVVNSASSINVEANRIYKNDLNASIAGGESITTAGAIFSKAGNLSIRARVIYGTYYGVWWEDGGIHIEADEILASLDPATSGSAIYSNALPANVSGHFRAHLIQGYYGIQNGASDASARTWIDAHLIKSLDYAVANYGGKLYVTAEKLEGNTTATSFGDPAIYVAGDYVSSSTYISAQKMEGGGGNGMPCIYLAQFSNVVKSFIQINEILSNPNYISDIVKCEGGTHVLSFERMTTQANGAGVRLFSGSLILNNGLIDCSIGGGASNPLRIGGDGLTMNNVALVAEATRDSIVTEGSGSAQNVKVYGTSVANKAKNANVTIQVGTLTVDTNVTP